jgi:hypothetical protein
MDAKLDLNYLILIPTVLVSGLLLYVCGFKKSAEPPLFEMITDEKYKKKQKPKDTKQTSVSGFTLKSSNHTSVDKL